MIELKNINKTFKVVKKTSGAKEAFKAMFHREYKESFMDVIKIN